MVYVIQFASRIRMELVPSWSCSQAVWHKPLLRVQWKTPGDGQGNCPKHVEYYFKNKFEKLVHLVGFIIRIYHDARSPERQVSYEPHWKQTYWTLQSKAVPPRAHTTYILPRVQHFIPHRYQMSSNLYSKHRTSDSWTKSTNLSFYATIISRAQ